MLPIKMSSLQKDPVMMSLFTISVNKIAAPTESECKRQIETAINVRYIDSDTRRKLAKW